MVVRTPHTRHHWARRVGNEISAPVDRRLRMRERSGQLEKPTQTRPQAMGRCNTKLSPDGEKFVYIDCAVSNSKKMTFEFRITNITDVRQMFSQ
jgi:hypothetical protein